jgi:cysteine-rich repeat protein
MKRVTPPLARLLALSALLAGLSMARETLAQLSVTPSANATTLAQALNSNATFGAATLSARANAAGTFSNGASSVNLTAGVVLGTGPVSGTLGPNNNTRFGSADETDSGVRDAELAASFPSLVLSDEAVLQLSFECPAGFTSAQLSLVFASDELDVDGSGATIADGQDVLGVYINGQNVARSSHRPNELVTANAVAEGRVGAIFNDDCQTATCPVALQADGLSLVLQARGTINAPDPGPGFSNTLKIAIGDGFSNVADPTVDSWVFLSQLRCLQDLCGNGNVDPGETCDDSNRVNGDCCSASCQLEPPSLVVNPPAQLSINGQTVTSADLEPQFALAFGRDSLGRHVGYELAPSATTFVLTPGSGAPLNVATLPAQADISELRFGVEGLAPVAADGLLADLELVAGKHACPSEAYTLPSTLRSEVPTGVVYNLGQRQTADTVATPFPAPFGEIPFGLSDTPAADRAAIDLARPIKLDNGIGAPWFVLVRFFALTPLNRTAVGVGLGGLLLAATALSVKRKRH